MRTSHELQLATTIIGIMMSSSNAGAQKLSLPGPVGITVRVYNYANIDSHRLERTQRRVSEIFLEAGFKIDWIHCPRCKEERSQYPACTPELGPNEIVLKIIPRIQMEKIGFNRDAFGLAAGSNIMVSIERLEEIAQESEQTCDHILGLMVAHEIGHALLGSDSHSSRGIMCPRWHSRDLRRESRQSACFTQEQIDRMHRNWMANQDTERPGGKAQTARIPDK